MMTKGEETVTGRGFFRKMLSPYTSLKNSAIKQSTTSKEMPRNLTTFILIRRVW